MTFLVGQQGSGWTVVNQGGSSGGNSLAYAGGYTATAGTATDAKFWCNEVSGATSVKVLIYDAGGNLVGQSNAIDVSGAGIPGLLTASLTSPVVLTAQVYKLVVVPNSGYFVMGRNSGSYDYACDEWNSATLSYASPPSTLPTPTVEDNKGEFIVWLDGTTAGDTTPPALTSPVGSATSSTAATVGATTDEGNGTLYAVVTGSATQPSIAQIKAGNDHTGSAAAWSGSVAVSSTGAKTLNATGLTSGSSYYAHLVHTDAAANDSNRVTSSQWTQLVKKVKLLLDLAAAGETVNGVVWADQVSAIAGTEIGEFTSQTIGTGSGGDAGFAVLKVPVSAFGGGSLSVGDTVQMYVRKPDLSKDSNVWPATVIEE